MSIAKKQTLFAGFTGVFVFLCFGFGVLAQPSSERRIYRLTLPDKNWSVDVSLADFSFILSEESSRTVYELSAAHLPEKGKGDSAGMRFLRIHIEPAKHNGDAAAFRDSELKRLKKKGAISRGSLKTLEYNQIPYIRYDVDVSDSLWFHLPPPFTSMFPVTPMNSSTPKAYQAFFVRDDVWLGVQLTGGPGKNDEKSFYSVLDSLRILDTTVPSTSFDYYQRGRSLYLQKEYKKATEAFRLALTLEHQNLQLEKSQWRDLVERSVGTLGTVGNMSAAKALLEYAVGADPSHHVFHYSLARVYAFEGDLDNTISSLEKAFLNQRGQPRLLTLLRPLQDPLVDSAFERFRKTDKFRKAVKSMER